MTEAAHGEPTKLTPAQRLVKRIYGLGAEFRLGPETRLMLTKYSLYALRMREIGEAFADPTRTTASFGPVLPLRPGSEEEVMVLTRDAVRAQLDFLTDSSNSLQENYFATSEMQEVARKALEIVADLKIS